MSKNSRKKTCILGISVDISADKAQDMKVFEDHWERFYKEDIKSKVKNRISDKEYATYYGYESNHKGSYKFHIGYEVPCQDEVPAGLVKIDIPEGLYSEYNVNGDFPKSLMDTWEKICKVEKESNFDLAFEEYPEGFDRDVKEKSSLKIYISVK